MSYKLQFKRKALLGFNTNAKTVKGEKMQSVGRRIRGAGVAQERIDAILKASQKRKRRQRLALADLMSKNPSVTI